jgi:hypothetical protein
MFRLRPHHFFEFSEPSLLAPLKAQVGLIYDRYTGISLNIRPTGGFREPSLRSAAPVLGETAPHSRPFLFLFYSVETDRYLASRPVR